MRKVLFAKWIPGVETEKYKNAPWTDELFLTRYKNGTNCYSKIGNEGYFHQFYVEKDSGQLMAVVEQDGEVFCVPAKCVMFMDSPEMSGAITESDTKSMAESLETLCRLFKKALGR